MSTERVKTMGMAASQARLLSITARLTDNENTGQAISYSKQRLADQTQQITNAYNEALNTTKLTVLTGFNGADANYTDISYNLMTNLQMAESSKQYVVTDTKGRVLVTNDIANAYDKSRGNYNAFLAALGQKSDSLAPGYAYSQADITVQVNSDDMQAKAKVQEQIHEAWDKYFEAVGINVGDEEHETSTPTISWTETINPVTGGYTIGEGYVSFDGVPINYEGTSKEARDLYDYAMAITEAYLRVGTGNNGVPYRTPYDMNSFKSAAELDNTSALKYYRNIFDKMQSCGYFTYTNEPGKAANDDHYIYASEGTGTAGNVQKSPLKDNQTFEAALRDGTLRLEYYSTKERGFKATTISEDNCIQEVKDERAIARAESKYTQDMADLENKDNKLDLELKKLDTEHNALQTEYESVKSVVDKNVEASFKIFS